MRLPFRRRDERALTDSTAGLPFMAAIAGGVSPYVATSIADVYACVRVLADAAASVPLIAYRRVDTGRERYLGRIAELLREPSPGFTQADLIGQVVAHLNLYGNGYIGKFRDAEDGPVKALQILSPDRMIVRRGDNAEPAYQWTDYDGHQLDLTRADVCHVRGLTTDGLIGLSPIAQCSDALRLARHLTGHANAFFEDGAYPAGIVTWAGEFKPNQRQVDDFSKQWHSKNNVDPRARGGRRKLLQLYGGMTYQPMTAPMDELQFVEQRKLSSTEIARIFRVPPWMIGAPSGDSLTYSNTEQQQLAFVMHSLRPWLVTIEQAITNDADLSPAAVYVEFLLDALLRADAKTRAQIYVMALGDRGWMTRAEVRRAENLEPEPPDAPEGGAQS
jgi:HK97 family phage portal protein